MEQEAEVSLLNCLLLPKTGRSLARYSFGLMAFDTVIEWIC